MEYFQNYLVIFIEMACFLLFHDMFSKSGSRFRGIFNIIWIAVMSANMLAISYLFDSHFIIKETIIILCLFGGSVILKAVNRRNAFFVSVLFVFLLVIADYITITLYTQILSVDTSNEKMPGMLVVLLSKAILLLLIITIKQISSVKGGYVDSEIEGMHFAVFPFISICMIAFLMSNNFGIENDTEIYLVWYMVFSLIAMNVLMVFYMKNITERNFLLQEKRMFEIDARGQQTLYRSLEEKIRLQRSISHDYKNHLSYIQAMLDRGDYNGISQYLKKINGEVDHDLDIIDTNNPIINTVVNTKYYEAKHIGAVIVCKINDLSGIQLEETDIILLLSNLFNNAVEAIEHCRKEKILRFKIVSENGNLILSMQNSYEGVLRKRGETYVSTKMQNKELHGIGIKNIIRIVDKYHGMYQFNHNDKEFHVIIIIPNIINPA